MADYMRAAIWDRRAVQNRAHGPKSETFWSLVIGEIGALVLGLGQFIPELGPASDFAGGQRANSFVAGSSPNLCSVKIHVVACLSLQLKLPQMARRMNPFSTSSWKVFEAVSFAMWRRRAASRTDMEISPLLDPLKRWASST